MNDEAEWPPLGASGPPPKPGSRPPGAAVPGGAARLAALSRSSASSPSPSGAAAGRHLRGAVRYSVSANKPTLAPQAGPSSTSPPGLVPQHPPGLFAGMVQQVPLQMLQQLPSHMQMAQQMPQHMAGQMPMQLPPQQQQQHWQQPAPFYGPMFAPHGGGPMPMLAHAPQHPAYFMPQGAPYPPFSMSPPGYPRAGQHNGLQPARSPHVGPPGIPQLPQVHLGAAQSLGAAQHRQSPGASAPPGQGASKSPTAEPPVSRRTLSVSSSGTRSTSMVSSPSTASTARFAASTVLSSTAVSSPAVDAGLSATATMKPAPIATLPAGARVSKYAAPFVPASLHQIATAAALEVIRLPEPANIDWSAYAASFLPPDVLDEEHDAAGEPFEEPLERTEEGEKLRRAGDAWVGRGDDFLLGGALDSLSNSPSSSLSIHSPKATRSPSASWKQDGVESLMTFDPCRTPSPPTQDVTETDAAAPDEPLEAPNLEKKDSAAAAEDEAGDWPDAVPGSKPATNASATLNVPAFEPSTYAARLSTLLRIEVNEKAQQLAQQTMFAVALQPYVHKGRLAKAAGLDGLWSMDVPGIREEHPPLQPGDLVRLRPLTADGWLHLEFEARVWALRRIEGKVLLRCPSLQQRLAAYYPSIADVRFCVIFTLSHRESLESLAVLSRVFKILANGDRPAATLRRWLFPVKADAQVQPLDARTRGGEDPAFPVFDDTLNDEQKAAADAIATRRHRIPFLIAGPPGTGKTRTLTAAVMATLHCQAYASVLLCAPSNTAADTLALRLTATLRPGQMLRINDPGRTFAELPEALGPYCHVQDAGDGGSSFGLPPWKKLMAARVVVTATHDVPLLLRCRGASNADIGRLDAAIFPGLRPRQPQSVPLHFTHLMIDEASQGTEADALAALLCVLPSRHTTTDSPTVVLCGDVAQLGPQVQSAAARSYGLDISFLERLTQRDVYRTELLRLRRAARDLLVSGRFRRGSSEGRATLLPKAKGSQVTLRPENCAQLVRNYRQRDPVLLATPSSAFYDDCLLPCAAPRLAGPLPVWDGLPNAAVPLLVEHVDGPDEWVDEGASWYNKSEEERVVALCRSLTGLPCGDAGPNAAGRVVKASEISVITPFREQVWRIRIALRAAHASLSAVSVGNVEVVQGAEHSVTIISTVRARAQFLDADAKRSMGLIHERKRMCVAITRCQDMLIVLGHAPTLARDEHWAALLEHAMRKRAYVGPAVAGLDASSGRGVSALEALENDADGAAGAPARTRAGMATHGLGLYEHEGDDGAGGQSEGDMHAALVAGRMAAAALLDDDMGDALAYD